ncbi:MAG TPA: TetR/AcrR family transcriptional regulator [Pseudonocardia sp.]|nr:TetR/AcrR family transcriptional regulator [Pseudonocardia sp.]
MPVVRDGRARRGTLRRESIAMAGLDIAAAEGAGALTMRRVAAELGVAPMSLYRHVADKEELLLLLLDEVAAGLAAPPVDGDPWRRLEALFTDVHEHLGRHRWVVPVLAEGRLFAPRALWLLEAALEALAEAGADDRGALDGYALLWHYTLGHVAGGGTAEREVRESRRALIEGTDLSQTPRVAALLRSGRAYDPGTGFRFGLRAILRGLRAEIGAGQPAEAGEAGVPGPIRRAPDGTSTASPAAAQSASETSTGATGASS